MAEIQTFVNIYITIYTCAQAMDNWWCCKYLQPENCVPALSQALCVTLGMSLTPIMALSVQKGEQYMKGWEAQTVW